MASPRRTGHDLRTLKGIVTATPTALHRDGTVDRASAMKLARELVAAGAAGLAPVGGTGEYTSLTQDQRVAMVSATVEAVGGAVPVMAGVIAPGLGDALAAGRALLGAGADALMVVTPYYARPTQDGILDYYKALSDALDTDLVLYEIPYRTGISLRPDTVARLAETTRIVAMKACNQELPQQLAVIAAAGERIAILSGEEDVLPMHVAMGARGGLLATSCLFPRLWTEICELAASGRLAESLALHARLMPAVSVLFAEHNPAPLKAALDWLGRPAGDVLPPLRSASAALRERLASVLPPLLDREEALALRRAA